MGWRRRKDGVDLSCFGPGGFQGGGVRGLMDKRGCSSLRRELFLSSELKLKNPGDGDACENEMSIKFEIGFVFEKIYFVGWQESLH